MRQRLQQQGLSFGGFVMALVLVCVLGIMAIKIVPMYIEFKSVKDAMNQLAGEHFESASDVRASLIKRLDVNYVSSVKKDDISVTANNGAYDVDVDYYVDKDLFANLQLTAHFEYDVTTKK